ncbi:MAG: DUF455 family protein [Bdellovibrio sp.]|jgi:uncharacterized ferritin-like protein (DUF455 family)
MESRSRTQPQGSFLDVGPAWDKLARVKMDINEALQGRPAFIPLVPARDAQILSPKNFPDKKGLASPEGQARMLHDLASIELQALELGLRTLIEFPEAPVRFREELATVTIGEADHFRLCLEALEDLGFQWGRWPIHTNLWCAVDAQDSLLDRILIVHRYLEGSGLDAGETLLRRLAGVPEGPGHKVVGQIVREEIGHVEFGSRWYREVCALEKREASQDFETRYASIKERLPKRIEKMSHELRRRAGFTEGEIFFLESERVKVSKFRGGRRGEDSGVSIDDLLAAF